jgi:CheY-like chemotaxis protein
LPKKPTHEELEQRIKELEKRVIDCKKMEEELPKAATAKPVTAKRKILVMDDEELIRILASEMLSQLGYNVEVSKDGAEAIELYKKASESGSPFDAVFLDLTIKFGMGGKETIEKLLEIDSNVKAIISSGYSNDPIMSDFEDYGFKGVLARPFNMNELAKVLDSDLMSNVEQGMSNYEVWFLFCLVVPMLVKKIEIN